MKWPLRKRRVELGRDDSPEVQKAKTELREVRSRWADINHLVTNLSNFNNENHYSEVISEAMRGGRK